MQPTEAQPLNGSNVEIRSLRNPIERHLLNGSSSGLQGLHNPIETRPFNGKNVEIRGLRNPPLKRSQLMAILTKYGVYAAPLKQTH